MQSKRILISVIFIWIVSVLISLFFERMRLVEEPLQALTAGSALLVFFIEALILVFIFAKIYKGIPGAGIRKGLWYGLIVWLVGHFLTMLSNSAYLASNMHYNNLLTVCLFNLKFLVPLLIKGLILGIIFRGESVKDTRAVS